MKIRNKILSIALTATLVGTPILMNGPIVHASSIIDPHVNTTQPIKPPTISDDDSTIQFNNLDDTQIEYLDQYVTLDENGTYTVNAPAVLDSSIYDTLKSYINRTNSSIESLSAEKTIRTKKTISVDLLNKTVSIIDPQVNEDYDNQSVSNDTQSILNTNVSQIESWNSISYRTNYDWRFRWWGVEIYLCPGLINKMSTTMTYGGISGVIGVLMSCLGGIPGAILSILTIANTTVVYNNIIKRKNNWGVIIHASYYGLTAGVGPLTWRYYTYPATNY